MDDIETARIDGDENHYTKALSVNIPKERLKNNPILKELIHKENGFTPVLIRSSEEEPFVYYTREEDLHNTWELMR